MIAFVVDCVPVAQPRQRHRAVEGAAGIWVQNYTPKKDPVNGFKESVRGAFLKATEALPPAARMQEGPLQVRLIFVLPRPKRFRKGLRAPYKRKPDLDNLEKSLLDALNGLAYRDDSQVCRVFKEKWYAASEEKPHVEVEIGPMTEGA